jgi:alpha-amylase
VTSNAGPNQKRMFVGFEHKGEIWTDILGWEPSSVKIDNVGLGTFPCKGESVSVWVNEKAEGRDRFGRLCVTP